MLTFLFWNAGGESPKSTPAKEVVARNTRLRGIIANLAKAHAVDLLVVAECPLQQNDLLQELNRNNTKPYSRPDPNSQCERITIYPRFPQKAMSLSGASESSKYTCRRVRLPGRQEFLLFAAHFGSKLYKSDESQTLAAPVFSPVIREAEKRAHHDRTVLVGDLNLNPFDPAMVGAEGLNAVMTRALALQGSRTVDAKAYPFFYNPTWGCFGDSTHEVRPVGHADHEPPGTCFYPARESCWYYWHVLDQVLLRPALLPFFLNRDLKVLTTDGSTSFLTGRGIPDRDRISDHLPLLFRLNV